MGGRLKCREKKTMFLKYPHTSGLSLGAFATEKTICCSFSGKLGNRKESRKKIAKSTQLRLTFFCFEVSISSLLKNAFLAVFDEVTESELMRLYHDFKDKTTERGY